MALAEAEAETGVVAVVGTVAEAGWRWRGGRACTTRKLASQLELAARPEPLAHLSMAKSSAGSSHGTGPIPMPKDMTNETTASTASGDVHACPGLESASVSSPTATTMPTAEPMSSTRRPARSIRLTESSVTAT